MTIQLFESRILIICQSQGHWSPQILANRLLPIRLLWRHTALYLSSVRYPLILSGVQLILANHGGGNRWCTHDWTWGSPESPSPCVTLASGGSGQQACHRVVTWPNWLGQSTRDILRYTIQGHLGRHPIVNKWNIFFKSYCMLQCNQIPKPRWDEICSHLQPHFESCSSAIKCFLRLKCWCGLDLVWGTK